jgi:hypothetical protein
MVLRKRDGAVDIAAAELTRTNALALKYLAVSRVSSIPNTLLTMYLKEPSPGGRASTEKNPTGPTSQSVSPPATSVPPPYEPANASASPSVDDAPWAAALRELQELTAQRTAAAAHDNKAEVTRIDALIARAFRAGALAHHGESNAKRWKCRVRENVRENPGGAGVALVLGAPIVLAGAGVAAAGAVGYGVGKIVVGVGKATVSGLRCGCSSVSQLYDLLINTVRPKSGRRESKVSIESPAAC